MPKEHLVFLVGKQKKNTSKGATNRVMDTNYTPHTKVNFKRWLALRLTQWN